MLGNTFQWNWLDVILAVVLLVAVARSLWTGFSRSVASLVGVVMGFWVGIHHYPFLATRLAPMIREELWRSLLAFFLLFVVVYLTFVIAGILVHGVFKVLKLSWMDRMLGGCIGLVKGLVLAGVIVFLLTLLLPTDSPLLKKSFFYPRLSQVAQTIAVLVPEDVRGRFMWKWRQLTSGRNTASREAI
jgi:membrane protein required for colicin V production